MLSQTLTDTEVQYSIKNDQQESKQSTAENKALINNNFQTKYLDKKIVKLKSGGRDFKTIINRNDATAPSITQRFIQRCNAARDYLLGNYDTLNNTDNHTVGIVYTSKGDDLNINGKIYSDGTIYSKYNDILEYFKSFIFQRTSYPMFYCRHLTLAWAINELDIKNINSSDDLIKSNFLKKFAGKDKSIERIFYLYELLFNKIFFTYNEDVEESKKVKFSSNGFSKTLLEQFQQMQQDKDQIRTYLFATPDCMHVMGLKLIIENEVFKIKFYDPNDTFREKKAIFNSINDIRNIKIEDLLDLNFRLAYGIANPTNSNNDDENCVLQNITNDYTIKQNELIDPLEVFDNTIAKIEEINAERDKFFSKLITKFEQNTYAIYEVAKIKINNNHDAFNKKLELLDKSFQEQISTFK